MQLRGAIFLRCQPGAVAGSLQKDLQHLDGPTFARVLVEFVEPGEQLLNSSTRCGTSALVGPKRQFAYRDGTFAQCLLDRSQPPRWDINDTR